MIHNSLTLGMFFTRSVSLEKWVRTGLFAREKLIYEKHLEQGNLNKVYWFTYGVNDDQVGKQLKKEKLLHKDIELFQMPAVFNNVPGILIYTFLLPFIHRRYLKKVDIFKTNQMDGGWSAVIAKWLYRKPLIARTGFTWSLLEKIQKKSKLKLWIIDLIESITFNNSSIGLVTTDSQKNYLLRTHSLSTEKIQVMPNFINTQLFAPTKSSKKFKDRILFVGRLSQQKNLLNLIKAVARTGFQLDLYGEGELREELEVLSQECGAKVNFYGAVDNSKLPKIINQYTYYTLPSEYEGLPKTLLEALSCGMICIGTNVIGINDVLIDGVNGYLAPGIDVESIYTTLVRAKANSGNKISEAARNTIMDSYSLDKVSSFEKKLIDTLLSKK